MEFLNGVKREFLPSHPHPAKGRGKACLAKKFLLVEQKGRNETDALSKRYGSR
jgi:hypothetical protein